MAGTDSPLVSAVIPAYGRPEMLRRAVKSVNSQTYYPIELVIIETPTPEGIISGSQIREYTDRSLKYIQTSSGVGASESRNIGMEHASGDYIAFLDDDDEWLSEKIKKQVAQLEGSDERTKACVVGNKKINPSGEVVTTYRPQVPDDPVRYQLCWNIGSFSTLMIHSTVPEAIGTIDETLDRREDQDFLLRIAREYDFTVLSEPLARKHSGEYTQLSGNYEAVKRANAHFREKHSELADRLDMNEEMDFAFEFTQGRTALDNKDYTRARRHFYRTFCMKPQGKGVILYFLAALGGRFTHGFAKAIKTAISRLLYRSA